ncbi:hypothetical protein HMPREF9120_02846 [Neisseria sp. oral taxon 020 str. F0370]|nr:hypothetical protein HMPREF9120_02846 [Neisseria sp. oral taxon 020 str. F0370]
MLRQVSDGLCLRYGGRVCRPAVCAFNVELLQNPKYSVNGNEFRHSRAGGSLFRV